MGQLLYLTNLKRSDYGKKVKVVNQYPELPGILENFTDIDT
jgi:hypothetical protein